MAEFTLEDVSLPESAFNILEIHITPRSGDRERTVAILLSCIPQLMQDVDTLRTEHAIKVNHLQEPDIIVSNNKWVIQKDRVAGEVLFPIYTCRLPLDLRPLLTKYRLSPRWTNSLLSLILYGFIVLPWESSVQVKLDTDYQNWFSVRPGTTSDFIEIQPITGKLPSLLRAINPQASTGLKQPIIEQKPMKLTITITEQMSQTELREFIRTSIDVKNKLARLPKTPYPRATASLVWGHHVWAYKEFINPVGSIGEVEKWLNSVYGSTIEVPESRLLAKQYERFQRAKDNFMP